MSAMTPSRTIRLAMWSGPRNISTAMMRAWENRPDCVVVDEPFYACYLNETGIAHPMRDEVIRSQSIDWDAVAGKLSTGECPADIIYQKQMTHHMLHRVNLDWTRHLQHCFLIRDPREVVSSYSQKRATVTADDIGIIRQLELYEEISQITGQNIPVIDARQVLLDPGAILSGLCDQLGISYTEQMLQWPAGSRESDGVWAPHWYEAVEKSTGFEPHRKRKFQLTDKQARVAAESEEAYQTLISRGKY